MRRLDLLLAILLALLVGFALGRSSGPRSELAPATAPAPAAGPRESDPAGRDFTLATALRALDVPERRWPALWWLREQGEQALSALPRLVDLLRGTDPVAARLAAEVLGRIGPSAAPAEEALRAAWDASDDAHLDVAIEEAMQRIGGWSCFRDGIPDDVSDPDRPFLRVVAEAQRRTWLKGQDAEIARRARREADDHARRLLADRLYRLGEQTRTLVATTGPLRELAFESRWSPPFLLCASDGTLRETAEPPTAASGSGPEESLARLAADPGRLRGLLDRGAEVAQAVYRGMLGTYGEPLGLKPLEAPFGGRPDLKKGVRSFEDGFPIVVWIWADRGAMVRESERRRRALPPGLLWVLEGGGWPLEIVADRDDAGTASLDVEAAAFGIGTSVWEAFSRQQRKWGNVRLEVDPLVRGVPLRWSGWRRDVQGRLVATGEAELYRAPMREIATQVLQQKGKPVPWMPLQAFLTVRRAGEAIEHWQRAGASSPRLGEIAFRYQAWALVRWLESSPLPARRSALLAALGAHLRGEAWDATLRRALGVRDASDWEPLEAEYAAWLDGQLSSAPGGAGGGEGGR